MLEVLRAKIEQAQLPNSEVVQAGFLTHKHQGEPTDFMYSRFALHHLPDFWKAVALTKIRQILRPGGVFRIEAVCHELISRQPQGSPRSQRSTTT